MIASTALSIGGPSPAVADNTTAVVVVRRSDSNLPATPDISRTVSVSSSALLPLIEETDILVEETHTVKRRRLSIIFKLLLPREQHALAYPCLIMVSRVAYGE